MRGWRRRLKAALKFVATNGDAFLAISIAVGVIVAEVVGEPSQDVVDSAILALLGTTAVALLRDRGRRGELESLAKLANDALGDRAYDVVWQNNHWNLHDRHHATVKKTEQIRFTRNQICAISEWRDGSGTVEENVASWRRNKDMRWLPAKLVHQFPSQGGTREVYCFDAEHRRGDQIDWYTEIRTLDRFCKDNEEIAIKAVTKSDYPRILRITWPPEEPPTRLEIVQGSQPVRGLGWQLKDGRPRTEETITSMAIGEEIRITWSW